MSKEMFLFLFGKKIVEGNTMDNYREYEYE